MTARAWRVLLAVALLAAGCARQPGATPEEPDAAKLNLQLGAAYMQQGRFDVALEKLNKALALNERMPEGHNAIALLYEGANQPALAEQHYQRAMALDPDYTLAQMNYAQFLCAHNRAAEGEQRFLSIINHPPAGAVDVAYNAYAGAAVCALAAADRRRADAYLRQALALKPDGVRALYQMANLYYATGDYLKARAFLQRYHAQADYSPESLWLGISIEDKLGDTSLRQEYANLLSSKFADSDAARRLKQP